MNGIMKKSENAVRHHGTMPEQLIMLLVFSVCAVICLRIFVHADTLSRKNATFDHALIQAENAAQILKAQAGDLDALAECFPAGTMVRQGESTLILYFGDSREPCTPQSASLCLSVVLQENDPCLGSAAIRVTSLPEAEELFSLPVCWQAPLREVQDDA